MDSLVELNGIDDERYSIIAKHRKAHYHLQRRSDFNDDEGFHSYQVSE